MWVVFARPSAFFGGRGWISRAAQSKKEPGSRLPAAASCLGRHAHPAGRSPNSSSLLLPLAAVVAVAPDCSAGRCCSNPPLRVKLQKIVKEKRLRISIQTFSWWARVDYASRASKKAPQGLFCPPDYSAGRCCSNPPAFVSLTHK